MNLLDVMSQLRGIAAAFSDKEAFAAIQKAEIEVATLCGGISNPRLKHLFVGTVTKNLTSTENTIALPTDAGPIVLGGVRVDGEVWNLIAQEYRDAASKNVRFASKSASRNGNLVEFFNLVSRDTPYVATVVFESGLRGSIYEDGHYGHFETQDSYGSGGEKLPILIVDHPDKWSWTEGYLDGATLRRFVTDSKAIDYTVFKNFNRKSDGLHVIALQNDSRPVGAAFPSLKAHATIKDSLPFVVGRVALPASLIPAVIASVRRDVIRDPMAMGVINNTISQFMRTS